MSNSRLSKYSTYIKLNDSVKESFEAYSILRELGLDDLIKQPIMVCKKFYSSDIVTVEYYSNHTLLLTSLICSTVDGNTNHCLLNYFSKFLEVYVSDKSDEEINSLMTKVTILNDAISSANIADLDNVLKSSKNILRVLSNFLREKFVHNFIKVLPATDGKLVNNSIEDPLFISKITVSLPSLSESVNVVVGSRFCNRLFPIRQSRLSEEVLSDSTYEKYKSLSNTYRNLDFASNRYLYNPRNNNSIIYSYLLMDSVQSLLVDLVSDRGGI